ncbi:helix-turn-helix transcriptional regulator [Elizabethkingia meningoseptica]|uniref:Transcriptional regulator n=1 Tax=Elizabethkingia meningoseptica TaxID=238 RepID=A0A1V3TWG2_ELIME|nr:MULTISPECIES: helix-turn-helix domain-containing protein [Elizabethkingia]AQX04382.1 transcriptional regulator [Elizabethkingia meningoseptica]AQX11846.1 transcriptional regulator [Elizabethkingia meningoseptica]AQX46423.1 transcriptional regulator [Elizabethkingia meningoseptica]EJK5328696.1 helix-turn-helix transcriptional regulator [Elizabethkingia meningoseptica]EOR31624.1 HxlR family transcriptional regulator [Elizabethkingia meningoseptica ATCC 13253 = NBRC 12535]
MGKIKENSTNNLNKQYIIECDTPYAVSLIGGRWKLLILCQLEGGKKRFGELHKSICNITERMLTTQLREMEKNNIVKRTVYAEVPPRVEYEYTEIGKELIPILKQLGHWGCKLRRTTIEDNAEETPEA